MSHVKKGKKKKGQQTEKKITKTKENYKPLIFPPVTEGDHKNQDKSQPRGIYGLNVVQHPGSTVIGR